MTKPRFRDQCQWMSCKHGDHSSALHVGTAADSFPIHVSCRIQGWRKGYSVSQQSNFAISSFYAFRVSDFMHWFMYNFVWYNVVIRTRTNTSDVFPFG